MRIRKGIYPGPRHLDSPRADSIEANHTINHNNNVTTYQYYYYPCDTNVTTQCTTIRIITFQNIKNSYVILPKPRRWVTCTHRASSLSHEQQRRCHPHAGNRITNADIHACTWNRRPCRQALGTSRHRRPARVPVLSASLPAHVNMAFSPCSHLPLASFVGMWHFVTGPHWW